MSAPAPSLLPRTKASPRVRYSLGVAFGAALFWLILRLGLVPATRIPYPEVQDEMSYLLGADTFAHGRLANPPHPMGRFFESPHVLIAPTYSSKYQPGQALFLAPGQKLLGSPFAGLILSGFVMIFCFGLMFSAWVSFRWSVVFSLASALCFQWPMYWTNSYWGGCVAAIGAALVLLGPGLIRDNAGRKGTWALCGITFAAGSLILFVSRPYEGGVLALAVLGSLIWRFRPWKQILSFAAAALPVLFVGAWWNMVYDRAVTGSAFQLPYLLHDRTYNVTPPFIFLPLRPEPHYGNPRLAILHGRNGWEAAAYARSRADWTHVRAAGKMAYLMAGCLGPILGLVLLSPICWRDDRCRFLLPVVLICQLGSILVVWKFLHYLAPGIVACLLLAACTADSREMAEGGMGRRWWAPALIALFFGFSLFNIAAGLIHTRQPFSHPRAAMIDECLKVPGKHLVIVQYQSNVPSSDEWVYNGADIDSQRLVLAHDLGPAENRSIARYYADRTVWKVVVAANRTFDLQRAQP